MKWFAHYDVPEQPRPLLEVFDTSFGQLFLAGIITFTAVCLFERTPIGAALMRGIASLGAGIRARTEEWFRAGTAAFFIALFALGGIIMTPELITDVAVIPWLQAAIAIGMFWRGTMALSAAGIVALYAYGVEKYGIYHMLDYPIFLGLAAYLALTPFNVRIGRLRPLDVARWAAAITLMWASVEKWAYPQWTYPLLEAHPDLSFHYTPTFYMQAAGFMEFSLAFALLWAPLVRSLAAAVLAFMFISAVFEFGKIDAVGHLMIIVILITVGADDQPVARRPALAPIFYAVALALDFTAYYGLHALIYGTRIW
ncbi:MAG TPA: hypothetical protein VLV50_08325 [Stellaceae bacterium]|nr:hypothetical protein [Stellaceae bacterium]